jgi:homospermidine synthase
METTGMVIRHGEAFTISDHLTVWDGDKAIYRPTVHYAYCPTDAAIASMRELEMNQWKITSNQRIMNEEIIDGDDRLGVLLMGHPYKSWWTGSLLNIHDSRKVGAKTICNNCSSIKCGLCRSCLGDGKSKSRLHGSG